MQEEQGGARRTVFAGVLAAALGVAVLLIWQNSGHRRAHSDITVILLDRNGKEIGKRGVSAGPAAADGAGYFADWAFSEAERLAKGKDGKTFVAVTALESTLQREAERIVEKSLAQDGGEYQVHQAALVSMELPDGAVRAMVGGRGYDTDAANRATEVPRQPGSSFMPYVYLTALENGDTPSTVEVDGPVSCGNWSPANTGHANTSRMTLSTALAKSINTIAVKLSLKAGREKVLANLQKLGIGGVQMTCSLALGDQGITLLEHTGGFAHFASGGKSVRPYAIVELRDASGAVVYSHDRDEPPQSQIFDPGVTGSLNGMLQGVVSGGTGKAAELDFTKAAGKTGTSSGYKDASFIGFTGRYVTGVWFGNDRFQPMNRMTGGSLPARAWKEFNIAAHVDGNVPPVPASGTSSGREGEAPRQKR